MKISLINKEFKLFLTPYYSRPIPHKLIEKDQMKYSEEVVENNFSIIPVDLKKELCIDISDFPVDFFKNVIPAEVLNSSNAYRLTPWETIIFIYRLNTISYSYIRHLFIDLVGAVRENDDYAFKGYNKKWNNPLAFIENPDEMTKEVLFILGYMPDPFLLSVLRLSFKIRVENEINIPELADDVDWKDIVDGNIVDEMEDETEDEIKIW